MRAKTLKLENENSFLKNSCEEHKKLNNAYKSSLDELKLNHETLLASHDELLEQHASLTTRDVYINDALLSSLKTPKSSHILFYDEVVTIWYSSLNARHILPTVTKRVFSS